MGEQELVSRPIGVAYLAALAAWLGGSGLTCLIGGTHLGGLVFGWGFLALLAAPVIVAVLGVALLVLFYVVALPVRAGRALNHLLRRLAATPAFLHIILR